MKEFKSNVNEADEKIMSQILGAIRSLRYGYVQIIIQDSKVIQIDKTEKIRLDK